MNLNDRSSALLTTHQLLQDASDVLRLVVPSQTGFTPTRLLSDGAPQPHTSHHNNSYRSASHTPISNRINPNGEHISATAAAMSLKLNPPTTRIYSRDGDGGYVGGPRKASFSTPTAPIFVDPQSTEYSDARAVRAIQEAAVELATTHGSLRHAVMRLEHVSQQHEIDIDQLHASQKNIAEEVRKFHSVLQTSMIHRMFAKLVRSSLLSQQVVTMDSRRKADGKTLRIYFAKWMQRAMLFIALTQMLWRNLRFTQMRVYFAWRKLAAMKRKSSIKRIRIAAFRQLGVATFRKWIAVVHIKEIIMNSVSGLESETRFSLVRRYMQSWKKFRKLAQKSRLNNRLIGGLRTDRILRQQSWNRWAAVVAKSKKRRHQARLALWALQDSSRLVYWRFFTMWQQKITVRRKFRDQLFGLERKNTFASLGIRYLKTWEHFRLQKWIDRHIEKRMGGIIACAELAISAANKAALEREDRHALPVEIVQVAPPAVAAAPEPTVNIAPPAEVPKVREPTPPRVEPMPSRTTTKVYPPKFPEQLTGSPEVRRRELQWEDTNSRRLNPSTSSSKAVLVYIDDEGNNYGPAIPPGATPQQADRYHLSSQSQPFDPMHLVPEAITHSATQRAALEPKPTKWTAQEPQLHFQYLPAVPGYGVPPPKPVPTVNAMPLRKTPGLPGPSVSAGVPSMRDLEAFYATANTVGSKAAALSAEVGSAMPSRKRSLQ